MCESQKKALASSQVPREYWRASEVGNKEHKCALDLSNEGGWEDEALQANRFGYFSNLLVLFDNILFLTQVFLKTPLKILCVIILEPVSANSST